MLSLSAQPNNTHILTERMQRLWNPYAKPGRSLHFTDQNFADNTCHITCLLIPGEGVGMELPVTTQSCHFQQSTFIHTCEKPRLDNLISAEVTFCCGMISPVYKISPVYFPELWGIAQLWTEKAIYSSSIVKCQTTKSESKAQDSIHTVICCHLFILVTIN